MAVTEQQKQEGEEEADDGWWILVRPREERERESSISADKGVESLGMSAAVVAVISHNNRICDERTQ